jgi:hypothetical protein
LELPIERLRVTRSAQPEEATGDEHNEEDRVAESKHLHHGRSEMNMRDAFILQRVRVLKTVSVTLCAHETAASSYFKRNFDLYRGCNWPTILHRRKETPRPKGRKKRPIEKRTGRDRDQLNVRAAVGAYPESRDRY